MYMVLAVAIEDDPAAIERLAPMVISLGELSFFEDEYDAVAEIANLTIEATENWPDDGIAICSNWARCRHSQCVAARAKEVSHA